MSASHSKSAFLYQQIRHDLQSGRYMPGQRIDPTRIAREFKTSPTPVRFALYRLVGEGLVADHARDGLHVPLPTELSMRDLYDWMQRLLLMACDTLTGQHRRRDDAIALDPADEDLARLTWTLFDAIAQACGQRPLHEAIKRTNDQLTPIRRAKQALLDDASEELCALQHLWLARDIPALKRSLQGYHERRKRLVPHIVAMLNEGRNRPR